MTDSHRVLCVCNDAERRDRVAATLERGPQRLSVLTAAGFDAAVEYVTWEAGDGVDVVVTDAETVAGAPAVPQATREHHPDLPLVVLSEFTADGRSGTVIGEVVGYDDALDGPDGGHRLVERVTELLERDEVDDAPAADEPDERAGRPDVPSDAEAEADRVRNDIVLPVKRKLVDASTPIDIERAVCDQLTRDGRFTFAWIGEYDEGERQVVPWVTGSAVEGWPVSETFPVGADDAETLVERVLRSRETAVVQDVTERPETVPWAEAAADNGCRACVLAPLTAGDERYGVFGVFSRAAIGEGERAAIAEIAESVSNVLHSMALEGRIEQQERTLRRYERLVETVGDGMYALDEDGHFMTVNNGLVGMTGYSREGLLGEHISIIMDDADVESGRERIRDLLSNDGPDTGAMEMDVHAKDGREIPCENQVALLVDDGRFSGTVGVLRDITERKRRERELRRQNERLEAFADVVSHDLRNPLSVAQGYVDLAIEEGDTERLDSVDEALARMEDIIADVLALARHGQTVTEPEPVDLREAVETAWGNVSTEAATLSLGELGVVAADRSRLLRLLENLFRNAVEHGSTGNQNAERSDDAKEHGSTSPDSHARQDAVEHGGSDVRVTVAPLASDDSREDDGFYVADDGPGMPEQIRDHAFDAEFTTSEEGLGIGLWVVREVASAHSWTVTATESESGGARFEFANVDPPSE